MREVQSNGRIGLEFEGMARLGGVCHVFTTRDRGGGGNLSLTGERDSEAARSERAFWADWVGVEAGTWIVGGLDHGAGLSVVTSPTAELEGSESDTVIPATDGLLTTQPGIPLFVPVADCTAVLLHAPGPTPALGVIHAGWRGLAAGILPNAVARIAALAGCSPGDLFAGISPCIGPAHFEVGEEVLSSAPVNRRLRMGDSWHVDLGGWAFEMLSDSGIPSGSIETSGLDTAERADLFFSHRRDGEGGGRQGLLALLDAP